MPRSHSSSSRPAPIRTVRVSQLECCELLGPGDVIRPWEGDDDIAPLASGASWRIVEDARVALLDAEQKIARPRQVYTGSKRRDYVPLNTRK